MIANEESRKYDLNMDILFNIFQFLSFPSEIIHWQLVNQEYRHCILKYTEYYVSKEERKKQYNTFSLDMFIVSIEKNRSCDVPLFLDSSVLRSSPLQFVQKLRLCCEYELNPFHLKTIVETCTKLKEIVFSRLRGGEFSELVHFPSNPSSVTHIQIHISVLKDEDLENIALGFSNLKSVYLRYTKGYTGIGLMQLDSYCMINILDDRVIELEEAYSSNKNEDCYFQF
jgi:hypothetical protein